MPRVEPTVRVLLAVALGCCSDDASAADLSTWSGLEQALGASANLVCGYSQETTENGATRVEQFVGGANREWSLLTVDGNVPTQSELNDYAKGTEQRAERTSPISLNVSNLVISDSVTALSNQDGLIEYRFRLRPEKPDLAEITKALQGSAIVEGGKADRIKFVLTNTRPAAYSLTFKVSNYQREINFEWQPRWNAFFRTSESTHVNGKLFGLKSVSISTEVRYFDFACRV